MKKSILIFIITYNASFRLKSVFNKIPLNNNKFNLKILISDDASKDDTRIVAKKIKNIHQCVLLNFNKKNKNYGGNIKYCLNYSIKNDYDYAVMIHGDDQYDPSIIFDMIKKLFLKKSNDDTTVKNKMVDDETVSNELIVKRIEVNQIDSQFVLKCLSNRFY